MSAQENGEHCQKCGGWRPPMDISYSYSGKICTGICPDLGMGSNIATEDAGMDASLRNARKSVGMLQTENKRLKKALDRALASVGSNAPVRKDVEKILNGQTDN